VGILAQIGSFIRDIPESIQGLGRGHTGCILVRDRNAYFPCLRGIAPEWNNRSILVGLDIIGPVLVSFDMSIRRIGRVRDKATPEERSIKRLNVEAGDDSEVG
jgi:hypothetical protein